MTGTTQTAKMVTVPNQPKTPVRSVRVEDAAWEPIQREAKERGLYVSDVVREALVEHTEKREGEKRVRPPVS